MLRHHDLMVAGLSCSLCLTSDLKRLKLRLRSSLEGMDQLGVEIGFFMGTKLSEGIYILSNCWVSMSLP